MCRGCVGGVSDVVGGVLGFGWRALVSRCVGGVSCRVPQRRHSGRAGRAAAARPGGRVGSSSRLLGAVGGGCGDWRAASRTV